MRPDRAPGRYVHRHFQEVDRAAGQRERVQLLVNLVNGINVRVAEIPALRHGAGVADDVVGALVGVAQRGGVQHRLDFSLVQQLLGDGVVFPRLPPLFLVHRHFQGLRRAIVEFVLGREFDAGGVGAHGAGGVVGLEGVDVVKLLVLTVRAGHAHRRANALGVVVGGFEVVHVAGGEVGQLVVQCGG